MTAALLLTVLTPAADNPRPLIESVHRRYAQALVADDQAAMDEVTRDYFRPDFVYTKADGRRLDFWSSFDGSQYEAECRRAGRADGPVSYKSTFKNWRQHGAQLTVDAYHDVIGSWLEGDFRHPVTFNSQVRETWVRGTQGWQAVRFDELWVNGKMDGKPFAFRRPVSQ